MLLVLSCVCRVGWSVLLDGPEMSNVAVVHFRSISSFFRTVLA